MIYSLSDLHLDYTGVKSMELFGDLWKNYENRIFEAWAEKITEEDHVLIAGDISWQISLDEALKDLERLDVLPGKKYMIKGNHDYWWGSISKLRNLSLKSIFFIQNDSIEIGEWSICGTRGWSDPSSKEFKGEQDEKIFNREKIRLKMSLDSCVHSDIICMIHYPPFTKSGELNDFGKIILENNVNYCLYGHLHGRGHGQIVEKQIGGTQFFCMSSDYLNFLPRKVVENEWISKKK